jgi:hypothetical protein
MPVVLQTFHLLSGIEHQASCISSDFHKECSFDGLVRSFNQLSFRAEREIFLLQHSENIRFLPAVEMTHSPNPTFYETVSFG